MVRSVGWMTGPPWDVLMLQPRESGGRFGSQARLASALVPAAWITGGIGVGPEGIVVRVAPGLGAEVRRRLRSGGVTAKIDLVEMAIPRARNPGFPTLRSPISFDRLYRELSGVCDLGGIEDFDVEIDPGVTAEHEQNNRRYAQVAPLEDPPIFEFAAQTLLLPWPYRLGLYAHEVGHVLDPDPEKTEPGADVTSLRSLGIRVGYDKRWPGKGLQVALEGPGVRT